MVSELAGLKDKAKRTRQQILEMVVSANKGHIGGSLSCVEILVALYFGSILHYDPQIPNWEERDRFILSKGHGCAALYAVLARAGFFPISELATFCQEGSVLEGHPNRNIPGIEVNTGSLGHGLGIGAGLALSAKLDKKGFMTIVLLSDGECYEGSVWEAAMFASHHKLNNLVGIIDRNQQCVLDFTENCNKLEPLACKWQAFGWEVKDIDGHNFHEILNAFNGFRLRGGAPLMIVANTIKGKGISFMEGKLKWHNSIPDSRESRIARKELSGY